MSFLPNMSIVMDSFGWAVLHSLWQGALAAFAVWCFRAATKERASDGRYLFGFVTLCTLLCAFIGTFLYYFNAASGAAMTGTQAANIIDLTYTPAIDGAAISPFARLTQFTDIIGLIWLSCFVLLGGRYLVAFRQIHKLRTTGLSTLPSNWSARLGALAVKSGVSAKVRCYISEHVASPITFGFWKPVVLVPAWFFTGMSAEQCDAILLHELAHIRRHDYISNILQIVIKTVFFYHPAVQYISKMVDTDREHACDDFAVKLTKCPESLATALGTVRIKAARSGGVFALAADGPDTPLMHRLKRLVGTPSRQLSGGSARSAAATIIAVGTVTAFLALGASNSQAHPEQQAEDVLAGAATTDLGAWGGHVDDKITVHGKTYTATTFEYDKDSNGHDIINGKSYHPTGNTYSVYTRAGKDYVVKQKGGERYIEIDGNWHKIGKPEKVKTNYQYGTQIIDGNTYKTKTNTEKNQTFIKINNRWYDVDEANLDRLIPTPPMPVTPSVKPSTYSYGYAYKDGKAYKVKTKDGKSFIKMDDKWRKASVSGGGDHGHMHVKIGGDWYNIETETSQVVPPIAPVPPVANYWISDQERMATQARIDRANERREAALERAEDQRERDQDWAEQQRENALERAADQREAALERAEEQREAALERAQEQRERQQEQQFRAQEQRMRAQEARDRAQEQRERAREKADRKREQAQSHKYEDMRDALIPVLTSDGYLTAQQTQVTMDMTSDDIFINGRQLSSAEESKYCKIVSEYGMRKDDMKTIIIKPDSFQVSSVGSHGNHRVTIGTFEHD